MLNFITESGTRYNYDRENNRVRRNQWAEEGSRPMRRDGEWLTLQEGTTVEVGKSVVMILEPLGEGYATFRRTSPVVKLENTGSEKKND